MHDTHNEAIKATFDTSHEYQIFDSHKLELIETNTYGVIDKQIINHVQKIFENESNLQSKKLDRVFVQCKDLGGIPEWKNLSDSSLVKKRQTILKHCGAKKGSKLTIFQVHEFTNIPIEELNYYLFQNGKKYE